jgi:hypothetical protein
VTPRDLREAAAAISLHEKSACAHVEAFDVCEHLARLRQILLQMRSWQNYVFVEGH